MKRFLVALAVALLALAGIAAAPTTITDLPPYYTKCAAENATCAITTPVVVTFGAPGGYTTPTLMTTSVACTVAAFGGDPKQYAVKACYVAPPDALDPQQGGGGQPVAPVVPPSTPVACMDPHGYYAPSLVPGLPAPSAVYSIFVPQPAMCVDPPVYRIWTDPVSGDVFKQGWCSTGYGDLTWSRHLNKHTATGLTPSPDGWPTE